MQAFQGDAARNADGVKLNHHHLRIVLLCAIVAMLDGFDTQSIAYVAPRIGQEWHLAPAAFGNVFGAGLLGLAIGAFVFSLAADRFGRRIVLLLCVALFAVFSVATASAASLQNLMLLRLATGLGLGGAMPNIIALTNEYAPARIKATLVTVMFCGFPLGSTVGGLLTAPLIEHHGWHWVFWAGGALPFVLLPILAWGLSESARFLAARPGREAQAAATLARISPEISSAEFIASVRAENSAGRGGFPVAELFLHGRVKKTVLVWLAFFMNLLVMYFLVNWLPSLLKQLGLPLSISIMSTALLNLGGVVGGVVLGQMIDRANPYLVLGVAYAAAAALIGVIAMAGANVALLLSAAAGCGFGVVGAQIGLNAVTANAYPTAVRSTGIGWALGVGRIGSILGPTIGGLLLGLGWAPRDLLLAAILPSLIAAGAVLALGRRA